MCKSRIEQDGSHGINKVRTGHHHGRNQIDLDGIFRRKRTIPNAYGIHATIICKRQAKLGAILNIVKEHLETLIGETKEFLKKEQLLDKLKFFFADVTMSEMTLTANTG